jgi:transcriptional regulator with XRE-family HTH domain
MNKATKPADEQQAAEARRLAELFKEKSGGLSQEEFGALYNIGTQGMMWQLLNGRRPLSLKSAVGFARGLKVSLREISPAIAEEVEEAAKCLPDVVIRNSDGSVTLMEVKLRPGRMAEPRSIDEEEFPAYVQDAQKALLEAFHANAPREVFDAVRVLFSQLKPAATGKLDTPEKDEAVKSSPAMQSIQTQAERAMEDAESHLATRTEDKRAARRVGDKRSKNIRH